MDDFSFLGSRIFSESSLFNFSFLVWSFLNWCRFVFAFSSFSRAFFHLARCSLPLFLKISHERFHAVKNQKNINKPRSRSRWRRRILRKFQVAWFVTSPMILFCVLVYVQFLLCLSLSHSIFRFKFHFIFLSFSLYVCFSFFSSLTHSLKYSTCVLAVWVCCSCIDVNTPHRCTRTHPTGLCVLL